MRLAKVTIHKYKSIEQKQSFEVDPGVTVLVGMNEAGKTAVLEAIAKTRYFQPDKQFTFSTTHDYPRREKKALDKAGGKPAAITCDYEFSDEDRAAFEEAVGSKTINGRCVITSTYDNTQSWSPNVLGIDSSAMWRHLTTSLGIYSKTLVASLEKVRSQRDLEALSEEYSENGHREKILELKAYVANKWNWDDAAAEYVCRVVISSRLPKFLYYDEYYSLPSRISIEKLRDEDLDTGGDKTARALLELADISVDDIVNATSFEDFVAELEATEAIISDELFKYWTANKNLRIRFAIDKIINTDNPAKHQIVEHVLDIRVMNQRTGVSLPLKNRSKGFNWFFSFLVWFKRIQEEGDDNFVLLLDEPGLNLHASAQADLLRFIEDLSARYQVIFTTHSPFMIDSGRLNRVRTIVEADGGTRVSDTIQEKDPRTLFPLQAALGYDLAQNLFISPHNLLVEGSSDLLYLQHISALLAGEGRVGLRDDITIVPTGGLDKVATFISLLRGSSLDIVCLLDTYRDQKAKSHLERMISEKLISAKAVMFFDSVVSGASEADIEDLFEPEEYLSLFNGAYSGQYHVEMNDLSAGKSPRLVDRIATAIGKDRFNHYRPARYLISTPGTAVKPSTLDRFEAAFVLVNKAMPT